jgi:nitrite reductase/ring-hydroxylating ferredoxin subunit/uncharacterized membrane protein
MFARAAAGHEPGMRSLKPLDAAVEAVEQATFLDPSVAATKKAVDAALPSTTLRDTLHGVWLGHPLHPVLMILPLGSWISASLLDLMPGRRDAARTLVGFGLAATAPTVAAGLADWSDLHPRQQRTGLVHAAANTVSFGLQFVSWRARRQGRQARGAAYSLAALGLGSVGAYLGGHLAYRQGAGANHAEPAPHVLPDEWTRLCGLDELPEGRPTRKLLTDIPVFALRRGGRVDVLFDMCAHLSGPLSEGELSGEGDDLCVTCPWHGSMFRVRDGQVQRGPSTYPQPVLQVRIDQDGSVLARFGEDD